MNRIMKSALPVLIAFMMLFTIIPLGYAHDDLTINLNHEGLNVIIDGNTLPKTFVSLVIRRIEDGDKMYADHIKADAQGNYKFRFKIDVGEYEAIVSSNGIQKSKEFFIKEGSVATATVRVEGKNKTLVPLTEVQIQNGETSLLTAIKKAFKKNGTEYEMKGEMIYKIAGEEGWQYIINNRGGMAVPSTKLHDKDEIVLIDDKILNPVITKLEASKIQLNAGEELSVILKKIDSTGMTPVKNKPIYFGNQVKNTDEEGKVVFKVLKAGEYTINSPLTGSLIRPVPIEVNVKGSDSSDESGGKPNVGKNISVYMRIEGYRGTIFDGKIHFNPEEYKDENGRYTITDIDGNKHTNDRPTVLLATIVALNQAGIGDHRIWTNDNYIARMAGEEEFDFKDEHRTCGWMIRSNDLLIPIGVGKYEIHDGDEIVWIYTAMDAYTGYIDVSSTSLKTGEKLTVTVTAKSNRDQDIGGYGIKSLVEGATVYVGNQTYITDKDGKVEIPMNKAGTYEVYAIKLDKNSKHAGYYFPLVSRTEKIKVNVTGENKVDKSIIGNDEYIKMYNRVTDPNASEKDVTEATKEAGNKLEEKANEIKTEKDAQKVVSGAKDVANIIEKAAERITTQEGAKEVAKESIKVVNILIKSAEKLSKDSDKKEVSKAAKENMKAVIKVIDKLNDTKEINKVAGDMIDAAGKLIQHVGKENGKEIIEGTIKVAEKAVEKASVKELNKNQVKVEKEKAVAIVDTDSIKEIAKNTVATVKVIKEKLKKNGIEDKKEIENKITIEIPKVDKQEVEAKLAKDMMKILKQNDIEKAEIKTENAVFNLTPNTFDEKENNEEIALIAKTVNRNNLMPLERYKVPKGCIVVDFNAKAKDEEINSFNEPIEVSIPYKGKVNKGEVVQVFLLKENGTIENMGGKYDPATRMVTFKTSHFSKYFAKKVKEIKTTFKDLQGYEWAKEAIEAMAQKGIISGREEGIFDPSANITRAEFATLMTKMMGYATENMEVPFTDVAKDAWYYSYVGAAYKNGIIRGRSNTIFDPNGNITREEMAVIVAKVLDKQGYEKVGLNGLDIFKDKENIASWAKEGVSLCVKENIISGMGNGQFNPKKNANRAQAAMMLYKLYNLINQ
ncbi:S-layer homology domain-containing protein [Crassaminicella indica]|uniref:S-layer homology domain-containing protein n=1 Tax=Crassaminicella indica TaxID=2855394 RepID=A0ABX8RC17_9CLOT|nr:S-layer homology domain-containing protein [Crassaminicella indica]QXM05260.1 S-layer homology domain-containing protein [Crassaminicella indica]